MHRSITNILFIIAFFSFCTAVQGQNYIPETHIYSVREGLSHRQVNDILEDRQGFIWIATPYGLNRFDGYTFKVWERGDGLKSDQIDRIFEDAYGYIWIIYPPSIGAIDLFDPRTNKIIPFAAQYGDKIPGGFQDKSGKPFLTKDSTLYWGNQSGYITFHPERGYHQVLMPLMKENPNAQFVLNFVSTRKTVWGILRLRDNYIVIEADATGAILQKTENTAGDEMFVYPGRSPEGIVNYYNLTDHTRHTAVCLRIETDNSTQIMPSARLLPAYDYQEHLGTFATLNDRNLLFSDFQVFDQATKSKLFDFNNIRPGISGKPRAFLIDHTGKIWLGTEFGLLLININKNLFKRYLFKEGEKEKRISCRSIIESGNQLIVNANSFIYSVDRSSEKTAPAQSFHKIPGSEKRFWYALSKDRQGNIFTGWELGIFQLGLTADGWDMTPLMMNSDLAPEEVRLNFFTPWAIYPDEKQQLWIGTQKSGLFIYDLKNQHLRPFAQYNHFDELTNAGILSIQPDRSGNIWLCTTTGFYRLDLEKGILERHWPGGTKENYLPFDNFCHFYEDKEGIFWLAAYGGGLISWDKKNGVTKQFSRKAGFPSNTICTVYEDEHEHLWIPSYSGLIQFDKKQEKVRRIYLMEDGIADPEFNRISHFQGADGTLYFGGLNGVTAFQPNDFYGKNETGRLPLAITNFQQFDGNTNHLKDKTGELVITNEIVLYPDDRFLNLEFALLSFSQTDHIQYAYKIEGVDADWTYQNEPRLRLGRLPYGTHTLHIKGQAANGLWASNELNIKVHVLRPFYLQYWFLLLNLLLISLTIRFFFKWRTRELQKNQQRLQKEVALQTEKIQGQAEELRQLDTLKTRLYTNITHEFRTPLTVILGMADEMESIDKVNNGNTMSPVSHAISLIRRNGKNLLHLINQLLDLSKLDSGSMKTHLVQADIIGYLQYLTESFYSMAQDKKVRLTFYPEIPELVMDFDEEKMQIIIYNLLSNAIKFTGEKGKVVLHATQTEQHNTPFLQLKVQDTGVGIAEKEIPYIFDRFYQVDNSSTRKQEGTGIGLALTKDLIELMGGTITVESTIDKGTTFMILLPVKQEGPVQETTISTNVLRNIFPEEPEDLPENTPVSVPAVTNSEKPVLLIIEDNPDLVIYIKGLLNKDYQIEMAPNGKAGIEKAFEIVPDIILSDVMMPEKDGYEVCDTLKNDVRTSHIPIILLTAKATQEDKVAGLRVGADAYLQKPFDKAELFVRLEKLVELRQLLQGRYSGFSQSPPGSGLSESEATDKPPTLDDIFLQKIRQVVQEKMGESDFGIQHLCRAVNLSNTQVFRKLKALTGENPSHFIRTMRLQSAYHLLQTTEMNVSEIAYKVGFSDPNYFSRAFHEVYGKAPSDMWR